jgi:hypothetical protein
MDLSIGPGKTGATLPAPCVEPVKLPTDRELEIKFKTDAEGLRLALHSELLFAHAPKTPRRSVRSVYFDTRAGDCAGGACFFGFVKNAARISWDLDGRDRCRKARFLPAGSMFACRDKPKGGTTK